jgi:CheY-like chemotaxis protein
MTRRFAVLLLVDDDQNDVFFFKRALRKADVPQPVRSVRDGEEAVQYLEGSGPFVDRRRHPLPCLVLLDVKLPKRSGLEVLKWLRARPELHDLPVVMITSSGEPSDQAEAQRYGVDAYRVKSVSSDGLVRLAREIRERAEAHCRNADPCPGEAVEEDP